MATTYWVDADSPSEAAPYDTQAKAAHTLATILAIPPAATDIIYCCAGASVGETIGAALACASGGTNATGHIRIIGCNSSGTVDGTRYIIDGGAAGINIFDFAGYDFWWLENIQVQNTGAGTKHGFCTTTGTATGCVFINCCATGCAKAGFAHNIAYSLFYRCVAYSNSASGFGYGDGAQGTNSYVLCSSHDNTLHGFYYCTYATIYGCISHGNTDDGISALSLSSKIFNSVIDNNTDDGIVYTAATDLMFHVLFGSRITNHSTAGSIAVNCAGEPVITGHCYYENNDGANVGGTTTFHFVLPLEDAVTTSDLEDLSNTNQGYAAAIASHNFATGYTDAGDPDLRRVAITIPWT